MAPKARASRSSRPRVSYREPSFEDDEQDDSFEESVEEEEQVVPDPKPVIPRRRAQKESHVPHTRSKPKVSYKEDSTDEEEESQNDYRRAARRDETFAATSSRHESRPLPKKAAAPRKKALSKPARLRNIGAPKKARKVQSTTPPPVIVSDGVRPPWADLPYEILRVIFSYASYPLISDVGFATSSVSWLISVATICRSFKEPALHALYISPPVDSASKCYRLATLLSQNRSDEEFNYNTKVRRLEIEVNALAHAAPGLGLFNLGSFAPNIPQLREVNIWDRDDDPATRIHGRASSRWSFRDQIFESLEDSDRKLTAWHWNSKFLPVPDNDGTQVEMLSRWHTMGIFTRLRRLRLSEFGYAWFSVRENETFPRKLNSQFWQEHHDILALNPGEFGFKLDRPGFQFAQSLNSLTSLKELDLRNSIVHTVWLQLLQLPLTRLCIINCDQIESRGFSIYLETHGSQMKELILHHNNCLNLSFLTILKTSCPRLQILNMDLTYRSALVASDARDPDYATLIEDDEEPTWPATLRELELLHLRNWTSSTAETFFASLVKSAKDLPDLRRLVLSASISIGWRDRAAFRDTWIAKLERIFLRRSTPPSRHLQSMKAYRLWKEGKVELPAVIITPARTKKRPARSESEPDTEETVASSQQVRRSKRTRNVESQSTDTAGSLSQSLKQMVVEALEEHIQGLCDIVDIRIDNLRPRENQLHETDFLDEEVSGDEDYEDGVDGDEDNGRYAW